MKEQRVSGNIWVMGHSEREIYYVKNPETGSKEIINAVHCYNSEGEYLIEPEDLRALADRIEEKRSSSQWQRN